MQGVMIMALYRTISMSFWTDAKVVDDFTPEDRYFYLYLFTNPHTNLCGCYEISVRQISNETGYSKSSVENLIERFKNVHDVILYSNETKEILLLNWSKYNWNKSEKFVTALTKEIASVKNSEFRHYLEQIASGKDTVSIGYQYGMDTTDSVTVSNTVSDQDKKQYPYKDIVDYLNLKAGTKFRDQSKDSRKHIKARFDEGFTLDDFKKVIDGRCAAWKGDAKMSEFLRPSTLFGTKFESYLNAKPGTKGGNAFNNFTGRDYDYDSLEKMLTGVGS